MGDAKKWPKSDDGLVYLPYTIENTAWGQDVSCGRFEAWKCSACGDNEKACGYGTPYARWSDCMWQDGQCIHKPNPVARASIARVVMEYAAKTCIRLVPYAQAYPENVDENGKVIKNGPVYPAPSIKFRPGSRYSSPLGWKHTPSTPSLAVAGNGAKSFTKLCTLWDFSTNTRVWTVTSSSMSIGRTLKKTRNSGRCAGLCQHCMRSARNWQPNMTTDQSCTTASPPFTGTAREEIISPR